MPSFLRLIRGTAHYSPSGISDSLGGCHPKGPHDKKKQYWVFLNSTMVFIQICNRLQDDKTKVCRNNIFGVEEAST